jgi:hypothetical protein
MADDKNNTTDHMEPVAMKDKKGRVWIPLGFAFALLGGSGGGMLTQAFSGIGTPKAEAHSLAPVVAATSARVDLLEKRAENSEKKNDDNYEKVLGVLGDMKAQLAVQNSLLQRLDKTHKE